jgi:hypothetical protein
LTEYRRILWIAWRVPEEADVEGTVNVTFCWVVDLLKRQLFVIIQTVTSGLLTKLDVKITLLGM